MAILPGVFGEKRLCLNSGELSQRTCEGIDLVGSAFHDEGDDLDSPFAEGKPHAAVNDRVVFTEDTVYGGNLVSALNEQGYDP
jgi:hypothetical protein